MRVYVDDLTLKARPLTSPSRGPEWSRKLSAYKQADTRRSLLELIVTAGALLAIWAVAWTALAYGAWGAALVLTVPAAAFLVRMFMIQHDCGHGSYFPSKAANEWTGRIIGVLTLTPYDYWRRTHAVHHATSGDLDRRGLGAVETLTVEEYRALPRLKRLGYRLYRHPLVMFGLGPAYLFFLQQRLPVGLMRDRSAWISTLTNSAAVLLMFAAVWQLVGPAAVLLVMVPTLVLAGTIGIWLFYVQHQFDGVAWTRSEGWKLQDSALHASSYYDLPTPLRWLTANIGVHHVHHLSSRIPFYRLWDVMRDHPELAQVSRLTLPQSLRCARLALWDESERRLVSFRNA
ncbi:MAG TPA: fatty acid desaturase [Caulobacteraceae bacterium]|jgi:omega-6 fatty acid desaturase (delta-12 desaturase)